MRAEAGLNERRKHSMTPENRHVAEQTRPNVVRETGVRLAICLCVAVLLGGGCSQAVLTSPFPATTGLPRPDRVLVYDFAVSPADAQIERRPGSSGQTEEDVRTGKALARALSANLVSELRHRGIDAYLAGETDAPGETTASIRGAFLRTDERDTGTNVPAGFTLRGGRVRTAVVLLQGTGLKLHTVAEGEIVTPSDLKQGTVGDAAIEADAKRTAKALAERIAQYYRREGWIK
jgi:hypothetical protein